MTATSPYLPSRGFSDEALDAQGAPREAGGACLGLLDGDLAALATGVREALGDRGVHFHSDGGAAEFLVDPVLTDGDGNGAAFEHAWAAGQLGVPLLEPSDLELRGDVLRHGGRAVDGVYRRTDADTADTEVGQLLAPPVRAGALGLVNAFGTGVADDKLAHAYVEDLVRFHLGEEPRLRSVETLDLCVPEQLERGLDELDTLVVKPRLGHGVIVCPRAGREDIERARERLIARPADYVAQPTLEISLHPTVIGDELRPRDVDLRPFVFMHGTGKAAVMPGGLTRVAFGEGEMVVNSTQDGGAKDTWVLP